MTDFELQQQLIDARRKQYGAQSQFQAPQGRIVGRTYVAPNPLEYLAAGLRSYGGMRGEQIAENELKQLETGKQKAIADALRGFTEQAKGVPAEVLPPDIAGPARPAQAPDMNAAYASLLKAPDSSLRQAGIQGIIQIPQLEAKNQELELARNFKTQQMQAEHELKMQMMREQNASRQQMQEEQRDFQREMAKLRAQTVGASAQPYFQPVQTAQGVMAFNARTGRVEPVIGVNGQPIIGAAADPALQGALAGAKKTATDQAESVSAAKGEARKADMFLQQLTQAENILKQDPTASGVGSLVDAAGRVVGVSTPGAQRAGQLEALSGWLVANVPRMEGPQSNFDVQNYMTMAGKIGDRTVPVQERLAALNEVRRLQEKYKSSAEQRMGGVSSPTTPKRIKLDAQGNIIQ